MEIIKARSFRTSILQASVFTPDLEFSAKKILAQFYPACMEVFNADPEVTPNLPAFPDDLPRIILRNEEDTKKIEIASARMNFYMRRVAPTDNNDDVKKFFNDSVAYFSLYQEVLQTRIGRMAAIKSSIRKDDDPGLHLSRHFCKSKWDEAPLDRPKNFELHAHKEYLFLERFEVNSWARSKTGTVTAANKKTMIIIFEQDINTLGDKSDVADFREDDLKLFYANVLDEFDRIQLLYYPNTREGIRHE